MGESEPLQQTDAEVIAKLDALQVGLAVLSAVLHLRRGEEREIDLVESDTTIRIASHPASNRVIVFEV